MKRRDFIHNAIHSAAGSTLLGYLGTTASKSWPMQMLNVNPDNDQVLVIIFLNGGNDSLNTIVPMHQLSILNALRPHVVLPENRLLTIPNTNLAMHPSMEGLHQLYQEGLLTVIRGVGYDDQNFSHFRSSDIWMSGSDADQIVDTGWMGRYLNLDYPNYPQEYPNSMMTDPLSLELGYSNSLLFQGPLANMSVVINGERDFYELVEDQISEVPDTFYGDKLAHVKLVRRQSQVYGKTIQKAARKVSQQHTGYPQTSIAQQLKICARLIAGGLRTPVYKVEIGGFDTHAGQVSVDDHTQGVHADLLRQLDEAIVAFMEDLKFLGIEKKVTGMTFSEFGRRIISNASNGTDHGSAGPMFIFGHHVNGGILGDDYVIDSGMTYEDNLQHQYDFRQVYGSILNQWLCVDQLEVDQSLMNGYDSLPLINASACQATTSAHILNTTDELRISPNPTEGYSQLTLTGTNEWTTIELIDVGGKLVQQLFSGPIDKGKQVVPLQISENIPSGVYLINVRTRVGMRALKIQKI